jgi:hypothetical protein
MMPMSILTSGGSSVRGFLAVVTIVMLFAHSVLGCCSHHTHTCGEAHDPVGFHAHGGQGLAACHSHATADSEQSDNEHQQRDDCRDGKCDLGRPANEQVAKSCSLFSQPMALPLSTADQASAGGRLAGDLGATGVLRPVRLHLVNQVLLI